MNRAAFTMLELLVAITILSMVIMIVYISFVSVMDTSAIARDSAEQLHIRQFLWRQLSETLTSIYTDAACAEPDFILLGEDEGGPFGPADKLRFCTSLPMSGPLSLPGVFKIVTYELGEATYDREVIQQGTRFTVDEDPEDESISAVLRITEEPLVLSSIGGFERESDLFGEGARVTEAPVQSFDVTYYDGEEWREQWDSNAEARMPWAMRIRVNLARDKDDIEPVASDESADLDMTIALPLGLGVVGEFVDFNHARNIATGQDEIPDEGVIGPDDEIEDGTETGSSTRPMRGLEGIVGVNE